MSPEAEEKILKFFDRWEELKKNGIDVSASIPRLFWFGHHLLHIISPEKYKWKCVTCNIDWETDAETRGISCPSCKSKYFDLFDWAGDAKMVVFCMTRELGKWKCIECNHTWESEIGTVCPACKSIREQGTGNEK